MKIKNFKGSIASAALSALITSSSGLALTPPDYAINDDNYDVQYEQEFNENETNNNFEENYDFEGGLDSNEENNYIGSSGYSEMPIDNSIESNEPLLNSENVEEMNLLSTNQGEENENEVNKIQLDEKLEKKIDAAILEENKKEITPPPEEPEKPCEPEKTYYYHKCSSVPKTGDAANISEMVLTLLCSGTGVMTTSYVLTEDFKNSYFKTKAKIKTRVKTK